MVTQTYDLSVNALYLKLAEGTVARTREIDDGTMVDLDAAGRLLGIEVLAPGTNWPLAAILRQYEISEENLAMLMACYPNRVTASFA